MIDKASQSSLSSITVLKYIAWNFLVFLGGGGERTSPHVTKTVEFHWSWSSDSSRPIKISTQAKTSWNQVKQQLLSFFFFLAKKTHKLVLRFLKLNSNQESWVFSAVKNSPLSLWMKYQKINYWKQPLFYFFSFFFGFFFFCYIGGEFMNEISED